MYVPCTLFINVGVLDYFCFSVVFSNVYRIVVLHVCMEPKPLNITHHTDHAFFLSGGIHSFATFFTFGHIIESRRSHKCGTGGMYFYVVS